MKAKWIAVLLGVLLAGGLAAYGGIRYLGRTKPLGTTQNLFKIGVLAHGDFLPDRTQSDVSVNGIPDALANRIIEHLSKSKRFIPVERSALRKVIVEQRFGKALSTSYLDKTLNKAIDVLENMTGHVTGAPVEPKPVGPGIAGGEGNVGVTATLSNYNDILKDFLDMGRAAAADYLVWGDLSTRKVEIPYLPENGKTTQAAMESWLRLRIVDVKTGTVVAAESLKTISAENLSHPEPDNPGRLSTFDRLGRLAAVRILDTTFPATIAGKNPLVVSRGGNDGIEPNDIFLIEREGGSVSDASGAQLGKIRKEIGRVRVVKVQETVSIVEPVESGAFFETGDIALIGSGEDAPAEKESPQKFPHANPLPRVALGVLKTGALTVTSERAERTRAIFTDTLVSRFSQTRRFQMIDRQEAAQLLTEQFAQAITENRDLPSAMGTLKGAELLVLGSLSALNVENEAIRLPKSNRVFENKIGRAEGDIRIVETASGDIIESRHISIEESMDSGCDENQLIAALAKSYSEQAVQLVLTRIFPLQIASIDGEGAVYVNKGNDGGLFPGEVLEVFRAGQPVKDPATGSSLGFEESYLGLVTILKVEDSRSVGKISDGADIQRGDILKRAFDHTNQRMRASRVLRPPRTGPMLPVQGVSPPNDRPNEKTNEERITLAVGAIRLNPNTRTTECDAGILKKATDDLIVKLSQTRRFSVLDRQEVDQVLDEKIFASVTQGTDIKPLLKELTGADYLIHGEIRNLHTSTSRKTIPYLDEEEITYTAVAEGTFRIVDAHTGVVQAAENVGIRESGSGSAGSLLDKLTTRAVSRIVESIFPIKLIGIADDNTIYINRGENQGMRTGSVFDVMRPGETMIDPDTGHAFGEMEEAVGKIEIVSVEGFRSRAKSIAGSGFRVGDILRNPQKQPVKPKKSAPKMKVDW